MPIILLTFFGAFLLVVATGLLIADRQRLHKRIANVVRPKSDDGSNLIDRLLRQRSSDAIGKMVDPLQRLVPRSALEVSVIRKRLILAGYRDPFHLDLFYASKVLAPIACVLLVTVTGTFDFGPFFGYALALGLGFLVPDFILGNRIKARQKNVEYGLAEALDLMVVCVEAGLGQPLGKTGRRIEFGADVCARRALAHHPGIAAAAERQLQRIDEDGLARAGLAGQHRKAAVEIDLEFGDDDEIAQ